MAQRYGGKFSPELTPELNPDGTPKTDPHRGSFEGAQVDPVGARANLLFLPAVPLVFMALGNGPVGLILGLAGAGALTLAAILLRGGLRAEAAYAARKIARRPAIPRKIFATALTGAGVALAVASHHAGIVAPALYGIAAAALHLCAFGIDPLRNKTLDGVDTFQQDRVARVVDEAEAYLTAMRTALERVGDRRLETRLDQFQATARDLIRTVEEDPRDLTAARRYLGVYLMGARDATIKFSDLFTRTRSADARSDYLALLDDLDKNFAARTRKLLQGNQTDMTIEIEVLRDRLQREGLHLDRKS